MKKYFLLILSVFFLFSCEISTDKSQISNLSNSSSGKINIVSSIIPISSIINYIGGDEVNVNTVVPAGLSPHNFDLKAENMIFLEKADLLVMVGLKHIDGFLDKALKDKNTLKLAEGIELIEAGEHEHEEEDGDEINEHNDDADEHNHSVDPHIWLGIKNSKIIAGKIKDKLSELKIEKKDIFQKNYEEFIIELDKIIADFNFQINGKKAGNFIVFHDAYNYLLSDLHISNDKKFVFKPNIISDLNTKEMKKLQDNVKQFGIKIIFKEPQFNDPNLEKFANEFKLDVSVIDPLGKKGEKNGYFDNLKSNLESLKKIYE